MTDDEQAGGAGASRPPSFPGNAPPAPPAGPPAYPSGGGPAASTSASTARGGFPPPGRFDRPPDQLYASWGVRLGGWLIDFAIFLVPLIVFSLLFRHTHTLQVHVMARRGMHARRSISALPFLITGLLNLAYSTILVGRVKGQTVGMMAVGVRAVRDEPGHGPIGYGRAFGRSLLEQVLRLLELISIVLGLIWLLDMLFPLWDRKRQTLHDKAVGSVVLRLRPPG